MIKRFLQLLLILSFSQGLYAEGKLLNPISDVCWECVFPITVSGVNITPGHKDNSDSKTPFCFCSGLPPKAGVPISFWEPSRLVDVTRHAYKLIGLGGISVGSENIKNRGAVSLKPKGGGRSSFYHVHWYVYPIFSMLEILTDFTCIDNGKLDVAYLTELDPLWNDDQLGFIFNPEGALFGNPIAQIPCIVDCQSSTFYKPLDSLFWCGGCLGSLYPFTGTVSHHVGPIQASSLLVHRMIAKLHRFGLAKGFQENEFCEAQYMPLIKKSIYKTQMIYPVAQRSGKCHNLGESDLIWGASKSFPYKGEDFVYLVWKKKQCCLDSLRVAAAGAGI
jgi:conjugal transfer pilus assembly protein TraU